MFEILSKLHCILFCFTINKFIPLWLLRMTPLIPSRHLAINFRQISAFLFKLYFILDYSQDPYMLLSLLSQYLLTHCSHFFFFSRPFSFRFGTHVYKYFKDCLGVSAIASDTTIIGFLPLIPSVYTVYFLGNLYHPPIFPHFCGL